FGPVVCLWFAVLALLGAMQIARDPAVLAALNPVFAFGFLSGNPLAAFLALGAVVLAVTGTEALYADMGHFGATPIRRAGDRHSAAGDRFAVPLLECVEDP